MKKPWYPDQGAVDRLIVAVCPERGKPKPKPKKLSRKDMEYNEYMREYQRRRREADPEWARRQREYQREYRKKRQLAERGET